MAVTTTGSTIQGLAPGLARGLIGSPVIPPMVLVLGDPDGVVTSVTGSDIAFDNTNGNIYISQVVGGSTWISLGSVA